MLFGIRKPAAVPAGAQEGATPNQALGGPAVQEIVDPLQVRTQPSFPALAFPGYPPKTFHLAVTRLNWPAFICRLGSELRAWSSFSSLATLTLSSPPRASSSTYFLLEPEGPARDKTVHEKKIIMIVNGGVWSPPPPRVEGRKSAHKALA